MRVPAYGPTLLLLLAVASTTALLSPHSALAQARLRRQGSSAAELERIALKAEADIEGQFATTRLEVVYRNTGYDRMEADFEYVLPPDTLVSSFAYWFNDEKVTARVVEKERAAEIYRHITTRQRDPALIERVNDRTFRARIFPIEGGANLRVEMIFRQVLPTDAGGMVYRLPLVGEGEVLEHIDVRVKVRPGILGAGIRNNLGVPVQTSGDGAEVVLAGENYRPLKDLRVRVVQPSAPLRTSILAAPSGGPHGFFALALTPARPLRKPVVHLDGAVYAVHTPTRRLSAHETLTVTGRYRHGGPLNVVLSDAGGTYREKTRVELGSTPIENSSAALLWASREIARRERSGQKLTAIQLSKRFGLPGRHTSWLAVPQAEMRQYRREKDEERIAQLADSLAEMLRYGKDRTRKWNRLHAELDRLCRRNEGTAADELGYRIHGEVYNRTHLYLNEKYSLHPNSRKVARLKSEALRLAGYGHDDAEALLSSYEKEVVRYHLEQEQLKQKPDAARIRNLERRFLELAPSYVGTEHVRLILEQIAVRGELHKVAVRLAQLSTKSGDSIRETSQLEGRRNNLGERDDRLRLEIEALEQKHAHLSKRDHELRARVGDPLIAVQAPADALRVVAVMPDGSVKPLTFRPESGKWEVRFDIPTYAGEGGYTVQVIVVHKDGRRSLARFTFTVDMTAPTATARFRTAPEAPHRLWVEIEAAEDTARVAAFLPGGEVVPLRRSENSRYSGWVTLPAGSAEVSRVKIVVTDRAHNRTTLEVDPQAGVHSGLNGEELR